MKISSKLVVRWRQCVTSMNYDLYLAHDRAVRGRIIIGSRDSPRSCFEFGNLAVIYIDLNIVITIYMVISYSDYWDFPRGSCQRKNSNNFYYVQNADDETRKPRRYQDNEKSNNDGNETYRVSNEDLDDGLVRKTYYNYMYYSFNVVDYRTIVTWICWLWIWL